MSASCINGDAAEQAGFHFPRNRGGVPGLDVQLVLSLGGGGKREDLGELAGKPIVVEFAPQLELLKRAAMCITHAGLNTALKCLSNGVPMLAIPIANDQPGVAARIVWTGTGEMVPLSTLSTASLRTEVRRVLGDQRYRDRPRKLQEAIRSRDGISMAAALIEEALPMHTRIPGSL